MIRTLALIACLAGTAAAAFGNPYLETPKLDQTQSLIVVEHLRTGYVSGVFWAVPVDRSRPKSKYWVQYERPTSPDGLSSLVLYCPGDYDLTICAFYDDTGFIAGVNIAIEQEFLSDAVYDWTAQGFSEWNVKLSNGTTKTYWTRQQYYVSPAFLATSPATRVNSRTTTTILQDKDIWVTGPGGKLYNISTNPNYITGPGSPYTEQACTENIGHMYFYNMSESLECSAENVFGWFPMVYSNELIGVTTMVFAKYNAGNPYYGRTAKDVVKTNVPHGPDCFYDLADTPGVFYVPIWFVLPMYLECDEDDE